ncbi:hypothetical protein F4778DRAFT_536077 [Xylariomycetidae sp. FL2044]|nr:hypothetical protein F4778DRAFT_536077 [Xylariomycetidae sp. FL2044]
MPKCSRRHRRIICIARRDRPFLSFPFLLLPLSMSLRRPAGQPTPITQYTLSLTIPDIICTIVSSVLRTSESPRFQLGLLIEYKLHSVFVSFIRETKKNPFPLPYTVYTPQRTREGFFVLKKKLTSRVSGRNPSPETRHTYTPRRIPLRRIRDREVRIPATIPFRSIIHG